MAITKRTVLVKVEVLLDGQLIVFEQEEYWEGGFVNGVLETTGPVRGRHVDVGDDVAAEDEIIRDVVNGNLHSQSRKDARDTVRGGG